MLFVKIIAAAAIVILLALEVLIIVSVIHHSEFKAIEDASVIIAFGRSLDSRSK